MPEINPATPPQNPDATDGITPPATNPQGSDGATNDDTVTLSKKDYANLVGQRDRANDGFSKISETVTTLEARQQEADKKEFLSEFIESNKQTYPDITVDDLMGVTSPEDVEELAKTKQRRYEDVVQDRLLKVQKTDAPILSPEDKAAELDKLKKNPQKGSFGKFLEIQQNSK
jgi:hypothetical protein